MLNRPEIGTREHVLMWLTTKDENEGYEWLSADCPAGQYSREFGVPETSATMNWLNHLALSSATWGALTERAAS